MVEKCVFLIPKRDETGGKVFENGELVLAECGKDALGTIRCMSTCTSHYRKLRKDNERRFKWGEEIVAGDCATKRRKNQEPKIY